MDLRKLSKVTDSCILDERICDSELVKINSLNDFKKNLSETKTDEGYKFLIPKNPEPEWLLADIEDYISDRDEVEFETKVKESYEPGYDLVHIILKDEDAWSGKPIKVDIQVPSKQELIDHFSALAEEAKENPHWKRGYQDYILYNLKEGRIGEWETKLKITKYTNAEEAGKYSVTLVAIQPGITATSEYNVNRKQLERNWESILEKLIEELIAHINLQFKHLLRSVNLRNL